MIELACQYYSEAFKENNTPSQNQEVAEFKQHLEERLAELPSKPCLFSINDLHRSIRRLKTKTSSGHEKVPNKLLKWIPISHYGFILRTFTELLTENSYLEHWKLSEMILLPQEKPTILCVDQAMLLRLSSPMDERQCRSSNRTIGFSRAPHDDNEIRIVSLAYQQWSSATNRFSFHLYGFH